MPLLEKVRIEVYLPDLRKPTYQLLLVALDNEFTYSFGGCMIIRGVDGIYRAVSDEKIEDRINLIYTDTSFNFKDDIDIISAYTDDLRDAVYKALKEESVLIVALLLVSSRRTSASPQSEKIRRAKTIATMATSVTTSYFRAAVIPLCSSSHICQAPRLLPPL